VHSHGSLEGEEESTRGREGKGGSGQIGEATMTRGSTLKKGD